MTDFLQLHRGVPLFQRWEDDLPQLRHDWSFFGRQQLRVHHALAFSAVLFPNFVLHNGMVFRVSERRFLDAAEAVNTGQISFLEAEHLINHFHVTDLFEKDSDLTDVAQEVLLYLARTLQKTWKLALAEQHPGFAFVVDLYGEPFDPVVFCAMERQDGQKAGSA